MLMLCLTYFHVMPEFIDFLLAFGYQHHAQDPYFCGFRQRTSLSNSSRTFEIPELAWSGSELQLCYNLKSAERSGSDPNGWSIRPCAIHHTFDVKNVRSNWVVIKGNELFKDRIEQATCGRGRDDVSSFETHDRAFAASLAMHLVFCEWAVEQWRWYINSLEDQSQATSRQTLTAPVALASSPMTTKDEFQMPPRSATQRTNGSIVAKISRTGTMLTEKFSMTNPTQNPPVLRTFTDPDSGLSQPLPPHITMKEAPSSTPEPSQPTFENAEEQDFSFAKMQKIQHIEEKAHEASLILKLNVSVIGQLRQYYDAIIKSKHFPQQIVQLCQDDLDQFRLRIDGVLNDLHIHLLRLETLLRLLADRKTLVSQVVQSVQKARLNHDQLHSILEYHNTEINKLSTKNMVSMTEDMNDIARKTKIETVSMKVITVVTLFFLPGTFISVCEFRVPFSLPFSLYTHLIGAKTLNDRNESAHKLTPPPTKMSKADSSSLLANRPS